MEKKNVNLNNEAETGDVNGKKKFMTKVKEGAIKAWHSKPGKVVRTIGGWTIEVGTIVLGLGIGAEVMCNTIDRHYEKKNLLAEQKQNEVPFVEENKSENETVE